MSAVQRSRKIVRNKFASLCDVCILDTVWLSEASASLSSSEACLKIGCLLSIFQKRFQ